MPVHVFMDNSNIFSGAQRAAKRIEAHIPWPAVRVYLRNLVALVEGGQPAPTRVLAGSVPPGNDDLWQYAWHLGYGTDLLRKVEQDDGRLAEQAVDELLHLKIANTLLDIEPPETLVLVTGDGRVSNYGTGFALQAERAIKRGWKVEVWSWQEQLSGAYARLRGAYPKAIGIHDLDPFYYSLTFVKGGVYKTPISANPVHVADRVVSPLLRGLKVY